jgi:hypothetical protein
MFLLFILESNEEKKSKLYTPEAIYPRCFFSSFWNRVVGRAHPDVPKGTSHHKRLFRGPSSNDVKK